MGCCVSERIKKEDETKPIPTLPNIHTELLKPPQKCSRKASTSNIPQVRQLREPILSQFDLQKITRLSEAEYLTLYVDKATNEKIMLTTYKKPKTAKPKETQTEFAVEAGRLLALDHPAVLKGKHLLEDKKSFAIVWEGAEAVLLSEAGNLDIEVVTKLAVQLFEAFAYCHKQDITHLRLRPAHLLLAEPHSAGSWVFKLAGLDESRAFASKPVSLGSVSPFIAPEVYAGEGCKSSDLWSCGMALYFLLAGTFPFPEDQYSESVRAARPLQLQIDAENLPPAASPDLRNLIFSLLSWDPISRPSAIQCLQYAFIDSAPTPYNSSYFTESLSTIATVQSRQSKLKTAIKCFVLESSNDQERLIKMRKVFRELDVDRDGMINKAELRTGLARVLPAKEVDSECTRIFKAVDFNENGELEYSEFILASYSDRDLFSTENLQSAFNRLDINRSGNVNLKELMRIFECKGKNKLEKQLLSLRTKATNELDFNEFREVMLKSQVVSA